MAYELLIFEKELIEHVHLSRRNPKLSLSLNSKCLR